MSMPLKSYASITAGITTALDAVIALLKTSESSGVRPMWSNTGRPVTYSTAGWPVRTA